MRLNQLAWSTVMAVSSGAALGLAAPGNDAASATVPSGTVQTSREVALTPEQSLTLARQYLSQLDQSATTIRAQLDQARQTHDVVKSLCLNDKLNQIDVVKRAGADRIGSLESAVTSGDKDRARHEFIILQSLNDRGEQVSKEAAQCIGEEAGFIGESQIILDIDSNIPNNNPDFGLDPDYIDQPPVLSSPTM